VNANAGAGPVPAVSVVLPVYNAERWLRESVGSILSQTLRDFELVAIDDGSTDRSGEILAELAKSDARVRVLTHERNRGLIATLNRGLSAARAPLVARHDADDVALPERLGRQVEFLSRHPEVGVLATSHIRVDQRGRRIVCRPPAGDTEIRWKLLLGNSWCHPTIMLRRELVSGETEVYRDFRHAEDFELWVRLLAKSRGATLPEPLVQIREHEASVSKQNLAEQASMVDRICSQQLEVLLPNTPLDGAVLRDLRRARRGRFGTECPAASCLLLLELFDAFARQPRVLADEVRAIERRWVARVFAVSPASELRALAKGGALRHLLAREPAAAARGLLLSRPRRLARAVRRRLRA
jgi:hypothetical protein